MIEKIGVALLVLLLSIGTYELFKPNTMFESPSVPATVAPEVKGAPVVEVAIKAPVKTYQGKTKAKLKLPAAVVTDDKTQVIAASQVKSDLHPQTVSTTINTDTGAVESYVKPEPYPWFAVETRGAISAAYGYKYSHVTNTVAPVGRVTVAYDVIRIKALTLGVQATADTDRDAFAGVAITYRW